MNRPRTEAVKLLHLFVAATVAAFAAASSYSAETKRFDVKIANGAVVGKKSVRVTRGDTVILRWKSDKPLEVTAVFLLFPVIFGAVFLELCWIRVIP